MRGQAISGGVFRLTIDGAAMDPNDAAAVTSCVVAQRLNLPSDCAVAISPRDYDPTAAMNFGDYPFGTPIAVAMGMDETTTLFAGKIAAIEPNLDQTCRTVEITGYDALFDLDFGAAARVFQESSDSQIATRLIEEAGFEPQVDATEDIYPYVLQNNVSAFRFLSMRARRIGYELLADGAQIAFRASRSGQDPVASLEYGVGLTSFRARVRAVKRGGASTRLGWDPKTKQVIAATVDSGPPSDDMGGEEDGYTASNLFPSSAVNRPDASIADGQIAQTLARAGYEDGLSSFLEGSAECPGNPAIIAGVNVELTNVGERFSGLYYVVATRHVYDVINGYRTTFEVRRSGV